MQNVFRIKISDCDNSGRNFAQVWVIFIRGVGVWCLGHIPIMFKNKIDLTQNTYRGVACQKYARLCVCVISN
uniref:Uncharacterized protein n=1 Tax=Pararge aegeria TaxID=116150 RepID=S4NKX2_9NEOP